MKNKMARRTGNKKANREADFLFIDKE